MMTKLLFCLCIQMDAAISLAANHIYALTWEVSILNNYQGDD